MELKQQYEHALRCANKNADILIKDIVEPSGFYNVPYALEGAYSEKGGLLSYTMDVYENLLAKAGDPQWKKIFEEKKITGNDLAFVALVHGYSKLYLFEEEGDTFRIKDSFPVGTGGERAVIILTMKCGKLKCDAMYAIRWADCLDGKPDYELLAKYPLILALSEASLEAKINRMK